MKTLSLFNHKGGVGKTTLTVNLADAFADEGKRVLLLDTDPQCNLSSFYLAESELDSVLGESSDEEAGGTLWSAVRPVVKGRGEVAEIGCVEVRDNVHLAIGDVLLSLYEEELPAAWTESFARKSRGYDVMCAMSRVGRTLGEELDADIVMYDVGPNLGALNRTILLDSDFFITPVHTDLYSLRALTTVGQTLSRWIQDWNTVRSLASALDLPRLLHGRPHFLGYVSSAFKVYGGKKARPHELWERKLPSRVKLQVVDPLRSVDPALVGDAPYKLGDIKNFHSLAAVSQAHGVPVGKLRGLVQSGQYPQIDAIRAEFKKLANTILRRMSDV